MVSALLPLQETVNHPAHRAEDQFRDAFLVQPTYTSFLVKTVVTRWYGFSDMVYVIERAQYFSY